MQACYSVCFAIAYYAYLCTSGMCKTARFLTVMDTHGKNRPDMQVIRKGNTIQVGDWTITCNLTEKGKNNIFDTACYWSRFSNELLYSNSSSQIADKA